MQAEQTLKSSKQNMQNRCIEFKGNMTNDVQATSESFSPGASRQSKKENIEQEAKNKKHIEW